MSPASPSPARTSARIASESPAPRFDAVSEQLAELGRAPGFPDPLPDTLPDTQEKLSGSGYSPELSGSGHGLPAIENLQWESNGQGGWEAWHVPPGVVHRNGKTYLGFLGKRRLASWQQESPERFRELVRDWIAEKRREKQIE